MESLPRAPAGARWRVCVHVRADAEPGWHPSLLAWLRQHDDGRVICAVEAMHADAFSDPASALAGIAAPQLLRIPDGSNMVDVLVALAQQGEEDDLIYVDASCAVGDDWDMLLARAVCEDTGIGVASPLTAASPVFSPFSGDKPLWMDVGHVNRWLTHLSRGQAFAVPAIASFCAYWRAAAVAALDARCGLAAAEEALLAQGWCFAACDWLYIDGPAAMDAVAPRARAGLQSFLTYHPLLRIRHGFSEAGAWGEASVPPPVPMLKPVQLHVAHSWGGGLGRWVEDYCEADSARWNLVLRSVGTWGAFGQRIALYRSHRMDQPLRDWLLDMPIGSIAISHVQYRRILDEIVRDFHVDAVIVSSLIGHALDILDLPLPTLIVGHDYTPFCAALSIRFDSVCTRCEGDRLRECFDHNPLNRFFRDAGPSYWEALRRHYHRRLHQPHIRVVAPSASVARNLHRLAPAIADVPVAVIPHGMTFPQRPTWEPPTAGRLRLVVLGSMAPQKGADVLAAALPAVSVFADVFLVGCGEEGERFVGLCGDRIVRRYQREELPAIIAGIAPHAGLLLSVVPETFSYTLSELWAMGVPPVATRLGGFADRIHEGRTGFLCDPDAAALVDVLRTLDADRAQLAPVRAELLSTPLRSCEDMVADYHRMLPLDERRPMEGVAAGLPGRPMAQCTRAEEGERIGALSVDRQVPLRTVLQDFLVYLRGKVEATPRIGKRRKRALLGVFHVISRVLK